MDFEDNDLINYLPPLEIANSDHDSTDYGTTFNADWFSVFMDNVNDDIDTHKLHELVIDYLVCCGYHEAAKQLSIDAQIKYPSIDQISNSVSLEQRNLIRSTIVNGDLETALKQIEELVPTLLTENKTLHFKLLQQQLVELIRKKDIDKVLSFASEYLADKCDHTTPELFTKLEQTYALLAFDNPEKCPFGFLMGLSQRNMLANEVNTTILSILNQRPISKLENLFRIIVWNKNLCSFKPNIKNPLEPTPEATIAITREIFGGMDDESVSDML